MKARKMSAHHFPHGLFGSNLDLKPAGSVREAELRSHIQRQSHIAGNGIQRDSQEQQCNTMGRSSIMVKYIVIVE